MTNRPFRVPTNSTVRANPITSTRDLFRRLDRRTCPNSSVYGNFSRSADYGRAVDGCLRHDADGAAGVRLRELETQARGAANRRAGRALAALPAVAHARRRRAPGGGPGRERMADHR